MAGSLDHEELKRMILNFRVSELQVLLGFAGRNKSGRKDQLQQKALDLLKLRPGPIQMKIRELHKKCSSTHRLSKPSDLDTSSNSSSIPAVTPPPQMKSSSQHSSHAMSHRALPPSNSAHGSAPLDFSSKYGLISCPSSFPVNPDVKFKKLPFFEVLSELLKPASLVPTASSRFQETNFAFYLTPKQATDISMSRDMRPGLKVEYTVQCQMRFCLLETSCEQDDNFPPSICVKVNGKMCPLPNPIPTNKPGVEPKRPSRPVNITFFCKISPTIPNQINVSWASEYGRGYVISVYLVKKLTSANLMQKLRCQGARNADHTRALRKMRMQIPCRASTCTHLQCFDASLYIQMNEKKPTWICPVCDKPAIFDTLVIDGLFMEIFSSTSDCNEIQFHEDGSWSPVMPKKEAHVIGSPATHKSLPASAATVPPGGTGSSGGGAAGSGSHAAKPAEGGADKPEKKNARKFEVIDLTLDSSDEEEPLKKKSAPPPFTVEVTSTQQPAASLALTSSSSAQLSSSSHSSNNYPIPCTSGLPGSGTTSMSIGSSRPMSALSRASPNPTSYREMTILDSPQIFCPSVPTSYADFLPPSHTSSLYNFPGYDLYSLLGQNDLDRTVTPYGLGPSISSGSTVTLPNSHKPLQPPASPDVISLD